MKRAFALTSFAILFLALAPTTADAGTVLLGQVEGEFGFLADSSGNVTRIIAGDTLHPDLGPSVFNFSPFLTAGSPGYGPLHVFQVNPDQFRVEIDTNGFSPVDYDGSGGVPSPNPATWAITGNNGARTNSVFRGLTFTIDQQVETNNNPYTYDMKGRFQTDGFIHWYTVSSGSTALSSGGFSSDLLYQGTIVDIDDGVLGAQGYDVYSAQLDVYLQTIPLPGAVWMGLALLGGMGAIRRIRRRREAS